VLDSLFPNWLRGRGQGPRLMIAWGFLTYLSTMVLGAKVLACGLLASAGDADPTSFSGTRSVGVDRSRGDSAAPQWFAT
jgi:hypothetical protein